MTTIRQLKEKATAAELALIEAVEAAVEKDMRSAILNRAIRFILSDNTPPNRDMMLDTESRNRYASRLAEALARPQA